MAFIDIFGNKEKREGIKKLQEQKEEEETKKLLEDGLKLIKLKENKAARNELLNALQIYNKKEGELYYNLIYNIALSFFHEQNYNSAIGYFDKCIELELGENLKSNAFLYKGVSIVKKGRLTERLRKKALEYFKKVIEIDTNDVDAWYLKGCMEFELGDVKSSIGSFDKVVEFDKNYENVYDINLFYEIKKDKLGKKKDVKEDSDEDSTEIIINHPTDRSGSDAIRTKTGLIVENEAEQRIANFLFEQGMEFQYRPTVSWADSSNLSAGFYIPELDAYLEHFDTSNDSSKVEMEVKINQFESSNKKLMFTTSSDEPKIEYVLKEKLSKLKMKHNYNSKMKYSEQKNKK